jgi:hypothetical protein
MNRFDYEPILDDEETDSLLSKPQRKETSLSGNNQQGSIKCLSYYLVPVLLLGICFMIIVLYRGNSQRENLILGSSPEKTFTADSAFVPCQTSCVDPCNQVRVSFDRLFKYGTYYECLV